MPAIDFAALQAPLSAEDPCGPDLDLEGDEDYLNITVGADGILPMSFFVDGKPFDRASIDIDGQLGLILPLLARTRDIRLLTLVGRFLVLNRDLAGFASAIDTIAALLAEFWEGVHPRAEGGSFTSRAKVIETLDAPNVEFPLQYMPLCESRRAGMITYRAYMFAKDLAKPREGEATPSEPTILQGIRDADPGQIAATRAQLERIDAAAKRIRTIWMERGDLVQTPRLDKLVAIAAKMIGLIDLALPKEQAAGEAGAEAGETGPAGAVARGAAIGSAYDARLAIEAVARYFRSSEPSSPVLPLIAQAQQLQGKTFVEIMQILLPNQASEAAYPIGGQQFFALPVDRLSSIMPVIDGYAVETVVEAPVSPAEGQGGEEGQGEGQPMPVAGPKIFRAETRAQAMTLLDDAANYFRRTEPASPIPWLVDRAKALADRDFLSVLKSVLPQHSLREATNGQ